MDYIVILCNTGSKENADIIAKTLVETRLAACVNIVEKIKSVYFWNNEVVSDEEFLLVIKTKSKNFESVRDEILKLHTYQTPEIISLDIKDGHKNYLDWIDDTVCLKNNI